MAAHILIIEDNPDELRKLRQILTREGFNIMTASDIKTAELIRKNLNISFILASTKLLNQKKLFK